MDSAGARAPSPWDKFPSPRPDGLEIEMRRSDGIPKLAPEVEQGNVEYKLILMNPNPERLHRLVTQLNWRLMEGNGQAYYQLGVADSGELIGLTRHEMEATLETLENMAGEIGASVVISREIEVRGKIPIALSLDAVNGMSGSKDVSAIPSSISSSVTSESVTTDTETSEAEGDSEADGNNTDSPTRAGTADDPNEIIIRSAPVPITHSFLRRQKTVVANGSRNKAKDRTLRPEDFQLVSESLDGDLVSTRKEADNNEPDKDPHFDVFDMSDFQDTLPTSTPSAVQLDPTLPPKTKPIKPPKDPKPPKGPKPSKGAKTVAIAIPAKTPEQIAQRMADKRAKRDKRREERKKALMDPVYDHAEFGTQDGGSGGVHYEAIIGDTEDTDREVAEGGWDGSIASPTDTLMSSLITIKPTDPSPAVNAEDTFVMTNLPVCPATSEVSATATDAVEPRLIVEALVVRKAGFGRGFVDLSQFDEELRHLPSFSLS